MAVVNDDENVNNTILTMLEEEEESEEDNSSKKLVKECHEFDNAGFKQQKDVKDKETDEAFMSKNESSTSSFGDVGAIDDEDDSTVPFHLFSKALE